MYDKYKATNMLSWIINQVVAEKIAEVDPKLVQAGSYYPAHAYIAVRFDFRSIPNGAISLLFHCSVANKGYISVYGISDPLARVGGEFPAPGDPKWVFMSDHDCMVLESTRKFLDANFNKISGWDWIKAYKVIDVTTVQIQDLRRLKDEYRRKFKAPTEF